jgi:HD-GYP domain-containing protein (c-di-GMP phosphodiesterase class II)
MESSLALQPCRLSPELLKAPLPFDLYSGKGILLFRRGTELKGRSEVLASQSLFRPRLDSEGDQGSALKKLEGLSARYDKVTEDWSCSTADARSLITIAGELVQLTGSHSDLCVCMAAYLAGPSHATRHSFAVAIYAVLLGRSLGLDVDLHTLARAALTMNLSLLTDHDQWAGIRGRLNEAQRTNVQHHPLLSANLLLQIPGIDWRWVSAIEQHHENMDGTGYPLGLRGEDILPEARILRVADTWCALVLNRQGKGRKPPRHALHLLSESARGQLDYQAFLALKKLIGFYPPGTFVRLVNRETALVVRWEKNGFLPKTVLSLISSSGSLMPTFLTRNVAEFGCRIHDYTYLDLLQMSRLPWERVWASA